MELLEDYVLRSVDRHTPVRSKKSEKQNQPFLPKLSKDIMDKMLKRDHLKRLAIINNDDVSWGKCKSSRNEVNVALRKVKSAFYASQIENVIGNPRKAWKPLIIFSSANSVRMMLGKS